MITYLIDCLENYEGKYLPTRVIHDQTSELVKKETKKQQMYGELPGAGDEGNGDFIFIKKI